MRRNLPRLLALLIAIPILGAGLVACSSEEPAGQAVVQKPVPRKSAEAAAPQAGADNAATAKAKAPEPALYNPAGKRDPFVPFIKPPAKALPVSQMPAGPPSLLTQDLGAFKFVGVIWTARGARALVEDPEGKGYTVTVGSRLGRGGALVTRITDKELVVREQYEDYTGATIVRESPLKLKSAGGK
jgi:type IV pilus assembly protein PilP